VRDDTGEDGVRLVVDEAEQHVRRPREHEFDGWLPDVVERVDDGRDERRLPADVAHADAEQAPVVRLGGEDDKELLHRVDEVRLLGRPPHRVELPHGGERRPDEVEREDEQRQQDGVTERGPVDAPTQVLAVERGERRRGGEIE